MRRIKKVIIICTCTIISIPLVIIIFILLNTLFYFKDIINFEDRIVKENDNVLTANVLYNTDESRLKLTILVTFKNNQWMVLDYVTVEDDAVQVINISGYDICTSERMTDGEGNVSFIWRNTSITHLLGIQRSLNEILQNFNKLAAYMDNLEEVDTDIYSANRFNHEWFWSDEANLERYVIGEYERVQFKTLYLGFINDIPYTYSHYNDEPTRFKELKEKWRRVLRLNRSVKK